MTELEKIDKCNELTQIIIQYDCLCKRWSEGEIADEYLDIMDSLRNRAFNLINEIKKN